MHDNITTIHGANSTSFRTTGLGCLTEIINGTVVEELNGEFALEFEYPINGRNFNLIKQRRIVYTKPTPYAKCQPFRIHHISTPINGIITVNAYHLSYDLSGYPANEFKASSITSALSELKKVAVTSCPFNFNTNKTETGDINVDKPASIRSILGNHILPRYGGEVEFDGFDVNIKKNRGVTTQVTIRYGKNLTDINQEQDISNVYTGVYPYWHSKEDGYVRLPEKIVPVPGEFDFSRVYVLDVTSNFSGSEKPTEEQIREAAKTYIATNELGIPHVAIDLTYVAQSNDPMYTQYDSLDEVELGDTVNIEFIDANINAKAKCVRTEFNIVAGVYTKMDFGDVKSNISNTIADGMNSIIDKVENQYIKFDAEIGSIKIDLAVIDKAVIDKADIEDLNAVNAEIKNLYADKATVGELNAVKATINQLDADKANITDLEAINGSITNLESETAKIGTLTADLAKIENLVSGNISSENIQTGGITGGSLNMSTIFVDDANIINVNASKIQAGEIDTGKVRITSENGGIEIADATQQFRDANGNVRIQMGQDNRGDFNFIIKAEDGATTLIDGTGVKEGAISDGLIKENMIGDGQVSGGKIDYNSFTTEFNKDTNTNTLKSSKVMLDDKNQTLDVAFTQLSSTADDTSKKVEKVSTDLKIEQGKIQANIDKTTIIEGEQLELKDSYNRTVVTVNSMKNTISEHSTNIDSATGKINSVEAKTNVLERDLESMTSKLTATETKVNTHTEQIKTAQDTANNADTKAQNAQATADKGVTDASDAFKEALKASGLVDELTTTVESTSNKVSGIEQNINSITQRVSSVETTTTTQTATINTHTTELGKVDGKISSAKNSAISTAAGDATSKANAALSSANGHTNAEVTKIVTSTNSKFAEIKATTDSITQTVSNTNTEVSTVKVIANKGVTDAANADKKAQNAQNTANGANNKIDNLEVGGRNLALQTQVEFKSIGTNTTNQSKDMYKLNIPDMIGKKVTVSFDWNVDGMSNTGSFYIQLNAAPWTALSKTITVSTANSKGVVKYTVDIPDIVTATHVKVRQDSFVGTLTIKNLKVEVGNTATDWTPAPEDISDEIMSVTTEKINAAKAEIKVTTDAISQSVSSVDSKVTTVKTTADNALTNANKGITDAQNAQNTANTANSQANTNKNNIATHTTEISNVTKKAASLETNLNSITGRVSSAESNITKVDGKIVAVDNRLKTAEQKITPDAITNTVSKSFYTKTDIDGKNYASTSEVKQESDRVTYKFSQTGGNNVIQNGKFKNKQSRWENWGSCNKTIGNWNINGAESDTAIQMITTGDAQGISQPLKDLSANTKYTIRARIYVRSGQPVIMLNPSGVWWTWVWDKKLGYNKWHTICFEYTPTNSTDHIYIGKPIAAGEAGTYYFTNICMTKGVIKDGDDNVIAPEYQPHPAESYEGSTIIDGSGVTVFNGAMTLKNKANVDVLKGDTKGNLTLGLYDTTLTLSGTGKRNTTMKCDYYDKFILDVPYTNEGNGIWIKRGTGATILTDTARPDNPYYKIWMPEVHIDALRTGNLYVTGPKNCLQETKSYGDRLINAYETTEYYYGDIGDGIIKNGECIVYIDDIFASCINTKAKYHVFTQVYNGSISEIKRYPDYFVVKGSENTEFSWELKAKRIGYENNRLDVPIEFDNSSNYMDDKFMLLDDTQRISAEEHESLEDLLLGGM